MLGRGRTPWPLVLGVLPLLFSCGSEGKSDNLGPQPGDAGNVDDGGNAGDAGTGDGAPDADAGSVVCQRPTFAGVSCGSSATPWQPLVAFPSSVETKARLYDRQFQAFTSYANGLTADLTVSDAGARAQMADFLASTDAWDFGAQAGLEFSTLVASFGKVAGLYGGVGIAADAFRYATLRDEGQSCSEVDIARAHLTRDIDRLIMASAITGVPGVIARGFARADLPGAGAAPTTPLFDGSGNPLPATKDNGTWRADNSGGQYPQFIWEDSCSRDMFIGWAFALAAVWEVIADDPSFDSAIKSALKSEAKELVQSLMKVGVEGYDLEIRDADGRRTYHGVLNENAIDRFYLAGASNGMYALMSLGIVAALGFVADDPVVDDYLNRELIAKRRLHEIARDNMIGVDLGVGSNFSNYNMAFMGGLLASRYLCHPDARSTTNQAVGEALYARAGQTRQPDEQGQSLYDFVFAHAAVGASAYQRATSTPSADPEPAIQRGTATLDEFSTPPFWDELRVNCDQTEIDSDSCIGLDGTPLTLLGFVGRGDKLVSVEPVPMRIRPASNYFWRSNPYEVNGESESGVTLLPGVDFRIAYWLGRWARR